MSTVLVSAQVFLFDQKSSLKVLCNGALSWCKVQLSCQIFGIFNQCIAVKCLVDFWREKFMINYSFDITKYHTMTLGSHVTQMTHDCN
jgi:hypothetical protein